MTVQERDEALELYLQRLRREAGLSLAQVCERTKIQERYVEALEAGRFGELPSNTHLRAFSLALAQASGGDAEKTALLVRRVLHAVAAPAGTEAPTLAAPVPKPAPAIAPRPAAPKPESKISARPQPVASVATAVAVPPVVVAREAAEAAEGMVQGASQRLKALPWQALLVLAGGAALLSGGLLWGVHRWQQRPVELEAPALNAALATGEAAPKSAKGGEAAVAADAPVAAAPLPTTELTLRARRSCWLVLQIDGQRLPTITLQDGDKRSWPVSQKAVLLAGNIGALRVWWRGDNLGYLGELGSRANGLVFEPGKSFRTDKGAHLALPAGVPE